MTIERNLTVVNEPGPMSLPNEQNFTSDMKAIIAFQAIVHQNMVQGHDYGVIPGTKKPTLLKPGAEKIVKLLGLSDTYEVIEQVEDWNKPFFHFMVKCKLISAKHNIVVSEGLGECNSMESKYRWRWVYDNEVPAHLDKTKLVKQEKTNFRTKGKYWIFRVDNEDIYSQVNTILKMAKKRGLVDAALSVGRLSDLFTQDLEDMAPSTVQDPEEDHPRVESQPVSKVQPTSSTTPAPERSSPTMTVNSPSPASQTAPETSIDEKWGYINAQWIKDNLPKAKWTDKTAASWLRSKNTQLIGTTLKEIVTSLLKTEAEAFVNEINSRIQMNSGV